MNTSPPPRSSWGGHAGNSLLWIVGVALCFALTQKLANHTPPEPMSVDGGWQLAMQAAWQQGWQFGRDVIFPHGPYAAFYARIYNPELTGAWHLVRLGHALALAVALVWTFRSTAPRGPAFALVATVLAVLAAAVTVIGPDAIWIAPALLLLALALDDAPSPGGLVGLLLVLLALASLAKFSFLVIAVVAAVAWTVAAVARGDLLAWLVIPVYVALIALLWLLAGQDLETIPDWLAASFEVARGYSAAMSLTSDLRDLAAFDLLSIGLLGGVWWSLRDATARRWRIAVVLLWAALLALVAKAGFVRHDGHGVLPFEVVVLAATLLVARAMASPSRRGVLVAAQALVLVVGAYWLTQAQHRLNPSTPSFAAKVSERLRSTPSDLIGIANDLLSPVGKRAAFAANADQARALLGGPRADIADAASIDIVPTHIGVAILAGLPYHPRPVVQSYQAYSAGLAARDVDALRRDGPAVVVLHTGAIDDRPPQSDGGHLWPDLMALYEPADVVPLGLVLARRAAPRTLERRELANTFVVMNTWVDLPVPAAGAVLQVRGAIRATLLGEAATLAFKPPRLSLTLRRADGSEESFRLVPGQLDAGFPISPMLADAGEIRTVFEGGRAGTPVTAFRVNAGAVQQLFWGGRFALTVTEIGGGG